MPNVQMRQGKSSELQVIGQLMDAGLDCYQPVTDDQAIDVVIRVATATGTSRYYDVQIKSARNWQGIRGSVAGLGRRENTVLILFNSTTRDCLWLDAGAIRARFPGTGGSWGDIFLSAGSVEELRAEGRDSLDTLRETLAGQANGPSSREDSSRDNGLEPAIPNGVRTATAVAAPIVLDAQGVAYVGGTTVKVIEIVLNKNWADLTAEELQRSMPHLTLGQIYAALAYYYQHQKELEADIERRRRLVQQMREEAGPSPVVERLRAAGKLG